MTNQQIPEQGGATDEQIRALAIREAAEYLNRILRSGLVSKADILGDLEAVAYRMEKGMNARGNVRPSKPVLAAPAEPEDHAATVTGEARVLSVLDENSVEFHHPEYGIGLFTTCAEEIATALATPVEVDEAKLAEALARVYDEAAVEAPADYPLQYEEAMQYGKDAARATGEWLRGEGR